MPIRPSSSSVINFSLKSLISQKLSGKTFFLFWHVASLWWYQCIVKIWIWLNHPKGHFKRSERSNLAPFLLGGNFLKNGLKTFSPFMQEASKGTAKRWIQLNDSKGHFERSEKGQICRFCYQFSAIWQRSFFSNADSSVFGPLLSIYANISETVHAVTNVCMKHIYKVVYLSVDLWLHLKVKSRSQTFQGVVSHKWYIIWSKFVWNTYNKSYMAFQFTF